MIHALFRRPRSLLLLAIGAGCHRPPVIHRLAVGETFHGTVSALQLEAPESGATLYLCPSEEAGSLLTDLDIRSGWGRFITWEEGVHEVDVRDSDPIRAWLALEADLSQAIRATGQTVLQAGNPGYAAALALDLADRGNGTEASIEEWARAGEGEIAGATTLMRLAIRAEGEGEWDRALALFKASSRSQRLPVDLQALGLCWEGSLLAHRLDEPGVREVLARIEVVLPHLDPKDRFLRELDLLNILHRVGDRLQAQALLETLDQQEQNVVAAYELDRIRSFLLEESGEYAAAREAIERAIRNCSDPGDLYGLEINRGRVLRLLGLPVQAFEVFEAASRLPEADSAPFLYQVGRGYARLEAPADGRGDLEAARNELEDAWDVLRQYPARPDYQLPFLEPLTLLELRTGHAGAAAKYLELAEDLLAETRADDEYLRSRFGRWSLLGQAVSAQERTSQGLDAWPGLARSLAWKPKAGGMLDITAARLRQGLSHARKRLNQGPGCASAEERIESAGGSLAGVGPLPG